MMQRNPNYYSMSGYHINFSGWPLTGPWTTGGENHREEIIAHMKAVSVPRPGLDDLGQVINCFRESKPNGFPLVLIMSTGRAQCGKPWR